MRVLLAGSPYLHNCTISEINSYIEAGHILVVNTYLWSLAELQAIQERFKNIPEISFECFDPSIPELIVAATTIEGNGFDAIICPPNVSAFTANALRGILLLKHKLGVIGCPNDSVSHLSDVLDLATANNVAVIHTPGVHAESVAEYTLSQIGFQARAISALSAGTGRDGAWPHDEALVCGRMLKSKTLGVIGGSGMDGTAVISLATRYGLKVISLSSGSAAGVARLRGLGAEVARDIDELVSRSDFISINCRPTPLTQGLIGKSQIELMKPETIIINPSAAEIFDKEALISEFRKPPQERRIGFLALDMPFGGRRDNRAFIADPDNALLKRLGVHFTPRMAGYTLEAQLQSVTKLAEYVDRYLRFGDQSVPMANRTVAEPSLSERRTGGHSLLEDIIELARQAGAEARKLRDAGLVIEYKPDGSPSTNADVAAETVIREGLRSRHHIFRFRGEESAEAPRVDDIREIIIDGIDGTRNFRDGNYGWCVSVGVMEKGLAILAVIYDPHLDEVYFAVKGRGAFVRSVSATRRLKVPASLPSDFSFSVGSFRVSGSIAIKSRIIEAIKKLGGRGREWGSVALSICAVARGGLGTFVQGNSKLHDHIAGLLIAEEAGVNIVVKHHANVEAIDIIVSHPSLGQRIDDIFRSATSDARG
jgi:myo-inositol-1(or 4)-monophosphatase